jgi:hypothetical protein
VHHFPHPSAALAEARRVLKASGRVAFTAWSRPEHNVAWGLIYDAIGKHGDMEAAKAPPPGGTINTPEDCSRVLAQAGFADCRADIVRREWLLPSARALVDALAQGTARMAALIAAQNPSALPAIEADITARAEAYRRRDGLHVPIAAILASGTKA